jgi:hypothetical protein
MLEAATRHGPLRGPLRAWRSSPDFAALRDDPRWKDLGARHVDAASPHRLRAARRAARDANAPPDRTLVEDASTLRAVDAGLGWLAKHQSADGHWDCAEYWAACRDAAGNARGRRDGGLPQHDVGVTGLALLAFLGDGYLPAPYRDGPQAEALRRGLASLVARQRADGDLTERVHEHWVYDQAIGALALVEAYAVTSDPVYGFAARRAVRFVDAMRNPYFGWRYGVRPGDNDTSVTVWMTCVVSAAMQVDELESASGDAALHVDVRERPDDEGGALAGARTWLDKMTDPDFGRVGYQARGSGPSRPIDDDRFPPERSEALTAAGLWMRHLVGESTESPPWRLGVELCSKLRPTWNPNDGSIDLYYWYFGSLAFRQVGGEPWRTWWRATRDALQPTQDVGGDSCQAGSWPPLDPWGRAGGRVYATAIATLTLESEYRYDAPPLPPPTPTPRKK